MFNNDITTTYNHQDATLEILVMLAGALVLGFILSWLINKLIGNSNKSEESEAQIHQNDDFLTISDLSKDEDQAQSSLDSNSKEKQSPNALYKAHPVKSSSTSKPYSNPKIDDFTKISGITTRLESELKDKGIKSFTDLRDVGRESLIDTLNLDKEDSISKKAQFWPHQASLAAKGEWSKLSEYQSFLKRTRDKTQSIQQEHDLEVKDDLKKIEGIGPKIEEILNARNISTYKELMDSERDTLKSYLDKEGDRFKKNEPETWPLQAGMAERGEWEELKIYQEFMDDDSNFFTDDNDASITANTTLQKDLNDSDDIDDDKLSTEDKNERSSKDEIKDDLKKIDGIGPKIQEILNNKGIHSYKDLRKSNRDTLKSYLDEAGSQFKLHDPETWSRQAGYAEKGEWRELDEYQDFMQGVREASNETILEYEPSSTPIHRFSSQTDNKEHNEDSNNLVLGNEESTNSVESMIDDLQKIEGVGPKIEELLKKAGINTFEKLHNCNSATIKDLLDAAGPQFKMHKPDTWPHQAKMAFKGEWEKLEEYQDFLQGGRE